MAKHDFQLRPMLVALALLSIFDQAMEVSCVSIQRSTNSYSMAFAGNISPWQLGIARRQPMSSLRTLRRQLQPLPSACLQSAAGQPVSSEQDREHNWFWRDLSRPEPGCVLVAPPNEVDHFFRRAVVLVLSTGPEGSRGVILEMATAFTLGEMAPDMADNTPFRSHLLFRGGGGNSEKGAIVIHPYSDLPGAKPVGNYGLFSGGFQAAAQQVAEGTRDADAFKFFFNQAEWTPGQLERECAQGLWRVGVISPQLCLRQTSSQSERWTVVPRNIGRSDEPVWDIARKLMGLSAETDDADNVQVQAGKNDGASGGGGEEARRPKRRIKESQKLILGMVTERMLGMRGKGDAAGVMSLLESGATFLGIRGKDEITAALQAEFAEKGCLDIEPGSLVVADDGSVTYAYSRSAGGSGGLVRERVWFSPTGLLDAIEAA